MRVEDVLDSLLELVHTLGLLEAQADVVAIELDRGLAELLPLTLRARGIEDERFALVHADALQVTELPQLPRAGEPTALVGPHGAWIQPL